MWHATVARKGFVSRNCCLVNFLFGMHLKVHSMPKAWKYFTLYKICWMILFRPCSATIVQEQFNITCCAQSLLWYKFYGSKLLWRSKILRQMQMMNKNLFNVVQLLLGIVFVMHNCCREINLKWNCCAGKFQSSREVIQIDIKKDKMNAISKQSSPKHSHNIFKCNKIKLRVKT